MAFSLQIFLAVFIFSQTKAYEFDDKHLWGKPQTSEETYVAFERSFVSNDFKSENLSSSIYSGKAKRDVMLWLAYSDPNNTIWNGMLDSVEKHKNSLTRICINGYAITKDGEFGDFSTKNNPQYPRKYARKVKAMGLPVTVMVTGAANRTYIEKMLLSDELRSAYIDKAISEAVLYGYDGYNMDVEQPCSTECSIRYMELLKEFAHRLHMINKTLSIDMGNYCIWKDYMGLDCKHMKATGVDRITSMDTYTAEFKNFKRYVKLAQGTLGSVFAAGMERNQLLASKEAMEFLISQNVTGIGIFRNPPTNQAMWDAMTYFKYN